MADRSIYRSPDGEIEILTLYDEAVDVLGQRHESLTVGTRYGDTHVCWRSGRRTAHPRYSSREATF